VKRQTGGRMPCERGGEKAHPPAASTGARRESRDCATARGYQCRLSSSKAGVNTIGRARVASSPRLQIIHLPSSQLRLTTHLAGGRGHIPLVRDCTPTEVGQGSIGNNAESFKWINVCLARRAQMGPIVTKVEDIGKLLTGLETRELQNSLVQNRLVALPLRLCASDSSAVAKLEFMLLAAPGSHLRRGCRSFILWVRRGKIGRDQKRPGTKRRPGPTRDRVQTSDVGIRPLRERG
jgi:hypothetical protein